MFIHSLYATLIAVAAFFAGLWIGWKGTNELWWNAILKDKNGMCSKIAKYAKDKPS